MTPMIDVVFLLIIFFLVSSHLARNESQLELELPIASSASDDVDLQTPRMIVNVDSDGNLFLAGRPVVAEQLTERFSDAVEKEGNGLEVRIRGSRSVAYSAVEPIMRSCVQAGIWNVSYAVFREEQR
ncbi:biopolymer transporter ExbD [Mariniblastus sp.]|nr:biopolymer transporter ExbD [Mariniblastus sp.]